MRRRRLGRCLLHADLAIEDGKIDEAREALAEAREIGGDSAELLELEDRLRELEAPSASVAHTVKSVRPFVVAAAGLLLVSAFFLGTQPWADALVDEGSPTADVVQSGVVPQASSSGAILGLARPRLQIVRETISARAITPRILLDEADDANLPPLPLPPIANREPSPSPVDASAPAPPAVPVQTEARIETGKLVALPPPRAETRSELTAPPRAPEPPVAQRTTDPSASGVAPPRTNVPDAVPAASTSAVRPSPTPEVVAAPPVDESLGIRAVLQRYAVAYSRLDAAAASAIWPAVDRGALERAFGGLVSQQVSLEQCDVRVEGLAARATCAGTARWQPKVGGRARTEPRQWSFELRKAGDAWRIERAITRGGN